MTGIEELREAMKEISGLNKDGLDIKGKRYTQVATRIEVFRKHFGMSIGLDTEIVFPKRGVISVAKLKDLDDRIIGSGHAFAADLSEEKSLEKLETVAVGRALASIGLAGGEYASDLEIESWKERYAPPIHIEPGEDDVSPEDFINDKIERMYQYVDKPRSTLEKFAQADIATREDPIFQKIIKEGNQELRDTYDIAVQDAEKKLKQHIEERNKK